MIFAMFHSILFYEQSLSLGENYIEDSGATAIACSMSRLTSLQVDSTVCPAHYMRVPIWMFRYFVRELLKAHEGSQIDTFKTPSVLLE
jgi:hypothetical protein